MLLNSAFRCLYLSFSPLLLASHLFTVICKASPDSHFTFYYFFFLGMVLIPVSCTMSPISIHSSSGTLSIRSRPINLFLTSTHLQQHTGHLPTWRVPLSVSYHFAFSYCSWRSQGKNTEMVCHSLLQWATFCQTSPPCPVHLGWPHVAWLS